MMTDTKTEMKDIKDIKQRNSTLLLSIRMTGSEMTYELPEDVSFSVRTEEDLGNVEAKVCENKKLD